MLVSLSIVGLSCLILSLIVFNGKYFQNRINCEYSPHKQIFLTCWFLLFAYFAVCLFCLIKTNSEKDILFFFGMQSFTFALYMISVYCFAAYVTATVSGKLSVFFSPSGGCGYSEKSNFSDVDDIAFRGFASLLRVLRSDILFFGVRNLEKLKMPYFIRNTT